MKNLITRNLITSNEFPVSMLFKRLVRLKNLYGTVIKFKIGVLLMVNLVNGLCMGDATHNKVMSIVERNPLEFGNGCLVA